MDRIREYLRAMQAVKRWDPERVVGFDRGGCEYSKAELSAHFRDRYVSEEEAERARLDALARRVPSNGTELEARGVQARVLPEVHAAHARGRERREARKPAGFDGRVRIFDNPGSGRGTAWAATARSRTSAG